MTRQTNLRPPGEPGGSWDVIVVGARVAGSATALQLARKGHRVLLVDRNRFPSDTLSTHVLQLSGLQVLSDLGLLERVKATGAPPISRFRLQAGPVILAGSPVPSGSIGDTLCVRRTRLDAILVEAAQRAGAEVREHFAFQDVVTKGASVTGIEARSVEGRQLVERARIVVGADGKRSSVARSVGAGSYETIEARSCCFYSYWSGLDLPRDEGRLYLLGRRTLAFFPTNDGQTMVGLQAAIADFPAVRSDVEGAFLEAAEAVPGLADTLRAGKREENFRGTPDLDAFFRWPVGGGWALVGDAGCHRDPITAQGISSALRDSVFLADAIHRHLTGEASWEEAGAEYHRRRDEAEVARYHWTADSAALGRPPAPETFALLQALQGRPWDLSRFLGVFAGTVRVEDFFSPDSIAGILSGEAA